METMNLKLYPKSPFMKSIVDYYQVIRIKEPVTLRTLPNGRLDSWMNFTGGFYFFDHTSGRFIRASQNGFFPLSDKSMLLKITDELLCLNIKFFPQVLLYRGMNKLLASTHPISLSRVFDKDLREGIYKLSLQEENFDLIISETEDYFTHCLWGADKEKIWLQHTLQRIEMNEIDFVSVKRLAKEFNVTERTLQRVFIKRVGLTPKGLSKIVRFYKTIRDIKGIRDARSGLSISLANGYYDQSHFGKDSKKITGLSPKSLLKNLLPGFPDVIVLERGLMASDDLAPHDKVETFFKCQPPASAGYS